MRKTWQNLAKLGKTWKGCAADARIFVVEIKELRLERISL
jgi:hypothetical protein